MSVRVHRTVSVSLTAWFVSGCAPAPGPPRAFIAIPDAQARVAAVSAESEGPGSPEPPASTATTTTPEKPPAPPTVPAASADPTASRQPIRDSPVVDTSRPACPDGSPYRDYSAGERLFSRVRAGWSKRRVREQLGGPTSCDASRWIYVAGNPDGPEIAYVYTFAKDAVAKIEHSAVACRYRLMDR